MCAVILSRSCLKELSESAELILSHVSYFETPSCAFPSEMLPEPNTMFAAKGLALLIKPFWTFK